MKQSQLPKCWSVKSVRATDFRAYQERHADATKLRWISALAARLKEIEVGSFVLPRLLPQMADIREVVPYALTIPGLHVAVLVPNLRGAQGAFKAGVHKLTLPVSVTNEHAMANIRKTTAQLIDEVREIVALRNAQFPGAQIEAGVSVVFDCTIAGAVIEDQTMRMCLAMAECGVDEIGLSDHQRLCESGAGATHVLPPAGGSGARRAARIFTTRAARASRTWSPRSMWA